MKKTAIIILTFIILVFVMQLPVTALAAQGGSAYTASDTDSESGDTEDPDEPDNPDDPDEPDEPEKVLPESVTLNAASLVLPVGRSSRLKAEVLPENAEYTGSFASSKPEVASVTQDGVIQALSKGKTTISYTTDNGLTAKCSVTVKNTSKSVTLNITSAELLYDGTIGKGFTAQLTYTLDKNAYDEVTFKSKNPAVATVSEDGLITPHSPGKATVVVRAVGGAKAKCRVTVLSNNDRWTSLNQVANRAAIVRKSVTRLIYGRTVLGRPLEAYVIRGENSSDDKVLFIDFACHGFEDDYYRDGKVLVEIGNAMVEYYSAHTGRLKGYTLVIVPCANPDGTIEGRNNLRACKTAFGRCTAAHVDMNRDFGTFRGKESRALKDLFIKYPPKVYLNFHGWLDTSIGTPWLARLSSKKLGLTRVQPNSYGEGYIINYVRDTYGASTCLVEYRSPSSAEQSVNKTKKFVNAIMKR